MMLCVIYDDVLHRMNWSITNRYILGKDDRLLFLDDDFTTQKLLHFDVDRLERLSISFNNKVASIFSDSRLAREQKEDREQFLIESLWEFLNDNLKTFKTNYLI